jgi:hypothetical protein
MTDELMTAQDEFDVSDAGVPTLKGAVATITEFNVVEKDSGTLHELTFAVEGLGFPITKGYWFEHDNPKAVQAGRGQLKRISKAATGRTTYNRTSLIGARILVDVSEDDSGFAQIKRVSPVTDAPAQVG